MGCIDICSIASAYRTKAAFFAGDPEAYRAAIDLDCLEVACAHMKDRVMRPAPNFKASKWSLDVVHRDAANYSVRKDFFTGSPGSYRAAARYGWLGYVCAHMVTPVAGRAVIWSISAVKRDALKYQTRSEFARKSPSAYSAARSNGWLDSVCGHMAAKFMRKPSLWTLEAVVKEASKFKTKSEFRNAAPGAYKAAHKNGWIKLACLHMPRYSAKIYRNDKGSL